MGIFIVEEMYRTGEIRPEDDKDLSLTQPINRCLQMIKADRSKQMHSFLVPQLVVTVLSPNSGPSPAHGQPGATEQCRFLLQPNAPNNCSASAQHLGGTREALNSSRLTVFG